MTLNEQLLSFAFSFVYGFIINISYIISYKYLYYVKEKYKFFNSFLLSLIHTLIYFKSFYLINGGQISIYFIIITISTFILINKKFTKKMSK